MRNPRWTKVRRDLWLHKSRTVLVMLAIAVGIAGAGAVLDTWALLRDITRDDFMATNPPAATLQIDTVDAAVLAAARGVAGVADVDARRTVLAAASTETLTSTAMLFAGDALATSRLGKVVREEGVWPPNPGGLVVERSSVTYANVAIGDTVTLRVGKGDAVRLPVVGIARDAGLAPGWMEHVIYGFVAPATLTSLGVGASLDQLRFTVTDSGLAKAVLIEAV